MIRNLMEILFQFLLILTSYIIDKERSNMLNIDCEIYKDVSKLLGTFDKNKIFCSDSDGIKIYKNILQMLEDKYIISNPQRGLEIIKRCINRCDPKICYYLAQCYEEGIGIEQNKNKAIKLYTKSAEAGNKNAIYRLEFYDK